MALFEGVVTKGCGYACVSGTSGMGVVHKGV